MRKNMKHCRLAILYHVRPERAHVLLGWHGLGELWGILPTTAKGPDVTCGLALSSKSVQFNSPNSRAGGALCILFD